MSGRGRIAGNIGWQYTRQQRAAEGGCTVYIMQHMAVRTSCSRGPAVHEAAESQQYIRQSRAGSTSGHRWPAVYPGTEVRQYIRHQRAGSTYITLHPSSVWPKAIYLGAYGARII